MIGTVTHVKGGTISECNNALRSLVKKAQANGEPVIVETTIFSKSWTKKPDPSWKEAIVATGQYALLAKESIKLSRENKKIPSILGNTLLSPLSKKILELNLSLKQAITKTIDFGKK